MKKFWIQTIVLMIVIFGSMYVTFGDSGIGGFISTNQTLTTSKLKVGSATLEVEIADTPKKRSTGLSGRESLESARGMLFVFPEKKKYQFWMKGMKFPLDFIFIREGKVVDLIKNVSQPLPNQDDNSLSVYEPTTTIDMMLETNAGFVAANAIQIGDPVNLIKE